MFDNPTLECKPFLRDKPALAACEYRNASWLFSRFPDGQAVADGQQFKLVLRSFATVREESSEFGIYNVKWECDIHRHQTSPLSPRMLTQFSRDFNPP